MVSAKPPAFDAKFWGSGFSTIASLLASQYFCPTKQQQGSGNVGKSRPLTSIGCKAAYEKQAVARKLDVHVSYHKLQQ